MKAWQPNIGAFQKKIIIVSKQEKLTVPIATRASAQKTQIRFEADFPLRSMKCADPGSWFLLFLSLQFVSTPV
jgi:hypothetical protein